MSVLAYGPQPQTAYCRARFPAPMALPPGPEDGSAPSGGERAGGQRYHLARCWQCDCDIDPLILRARQLRRRGAHGQALCLEQELLPLF
jgi:hypothetical protein